MVMFIYSGLLLYMNFYRLPRHVRISLPRAAVLLWSVLFFGFFAGWTAWRHFIPGT